MLFLKVNATFLGTKKSLQRLRVRGEKNLVPLTILTTNNALSNKAVLPVAVFIGSISFL